MPSMTNVAVLIPVWNDARELPRTLGALARAAANVCEIEVVVVAGGDAGQYEEAKRVSADFSAGPCAVLPQRPLGKMRALREGMEAVLSRPSSYLLLLDADTRLEANSLAAAIALLDERPELAGLGGLIRGGSGGIGAAHDLVNLACETRRVGLTAVTGHAIVLRGSVVWAHWQQVFAEHDYPLHIDYQICERIVALTGLTFVVHPTFTMQTPRARGMAFLQAERRHHRAMFARASLPARGRYLGGAVLTAVLPALVPLALSVMVVPALWPVALAAALVTVRQLLRFRRRYVLARSADAEIATVSFAAFLRDEWVFALSALLGAGDRLRMRADDPRFRGYRDPQ